MKGPNVSVERLSSWRIACRSIGLRAWDSRAAAGRSNQRCSRAERRCGKAAGMDKVVPSAARAVADVPDGATLLFGGFGVVQGWPNSLLLALRDHGARDLTLVFNTPGVGPLSAQLLAEAGLVRRVIASFAAYPTRSTPIEEQIRAGKIALELVPQGTLVERVRAGGAGIPAFYTPTGAGTLVAEGKERRTFGTREYVLETALTADYAFI